MLATVDFISDLLSAVTSWFSVVFEKTGMSSFYLSMVFLWLAGKFLLRPIFGSAGSDTVKKRKDVKDDG